LTILSLGLKGVLLKMIGIAEISYGIGKGMLNFSNEG